ncbi:hypothetical protein MVEN_01636800 [Mycena venus]|uniref:Mid2 domain-containing protein n=1 Tax=Mycena venus TaxID=2733690 RepID=A0A8H6XQ87_9AGAR|nr:hypothetical protein MVEN_01636800 [Mycena venus]
MTRLTTPRGALFLTYSSTYILPGNMTVSVSPSCSLSTIVWKTRSLAITVTPSLKSALLLFSFFECLSNVRAQTVTVPIGYSSIETVTPIGTGQNGAETTYRLIRAGGFNPTDTDTFIIDASHVLQTIPEVHFTRSCDINNGAMTCYDIEQGDNGVTTYSAPFEYQTFVIGVGGAGGGGITTGRGSSGTTSPSNPDTAKPSSDSTLSFAPDKSSPTLHSGSAASSGSDSSSLDPSSPSRTTTSGRLDSGPSLGPTASDSSSNASGPSNSADSLNTFTSSTKKSNAGIIIGATLGPICLIIALLLCLCIKRHSRLHKEQLVTPNTYTVTPFSDDPLASASPNSSSVPVTRLPARGASANMTATPFPIGRTRTLGAFSEKAWDASGSGDGTAATTPQTISESSPINSTQRPWSVQLPLVGATAATEDSIPETRSGGGPGSDGGVSNSSSGEAAASLDPVPLLVEEMRRLMEQMANMNGAPPTYQE